MAEAKRCLKTTASRRMMLFAPTIGALAVVLLTAAAALAQSTGSTLQGTITDEQGAVMPGATVVMPTSRRAGPASRHRRARLVSRDGALTGQLRGAGERCRDSRPRFGRD